MLRRIGPKYGRCDTNAGCPDIFELENGDTAVIGTECSQELLDKLPKDANVGLGEIIVIVPRELLIKAKPYLP